MDFIVTLKNPYLYALLNKKVDSLTIYRKMIADQSMIIYNTTAYVMGNNYSSIKMPMQFDYRSKTPYWLNFLLYRF